MEILQANSGITVLFKRTPSKLVDAKYYVRCGQLDEELPEQKGLTHALEHMYFQGTTTRDWKTILKDFRKTGTDYNAETRHSTTSYHINCPRDFFEESFAALSDIIYRSNFPKERWENVERNVVVTELLNELDINEFIFGSGILKSTFGDYYANPTTYVENVQKANVEDLKYFSDNYYKGKNLYLSIAGNFTQNQLLKIVDRYDQWENKQPKKRKKLKFKFNPDTFYLEKENISQTYISLLAPIKKYKNIEEQIAFNIGMDLLYHYLYEKLVYKGGFCYDISVSTCFEIPRNGFMSTDATCQPEMFEVLLVNIKKAFDSFLTEKLNSETIYEGRISYLREAICLEDNIDKVTRLMANYYRLGYNVDPFEAMYSGIKTVKDSTIRSVMEECLSNRMKLSVMKGRGLT